MSRMSPFELPGFTLPLDDNVAQEFQSAVDPHAYFEAVKTMWEVSMMRVMNAITDKPEWQKKVFNEEITSKWRQEVFGTSTDLTEEMMDWVIEELKYKAKPSLKAGFVPAFDADVVKSDTAISGDLKLALQRAVRPLEDVPEEQKDYHPGTDKQVLDLVHPSLFPLVYGRTRILKDVLIGLDECLSRSGSGQTLPVPPESDAGERMISHDTFAYSRKFQWLPCDIKFDDSTDGCHISSYINNLHPRKHRDLYVIIQKIISRTIPLWNATLDPLINANPDDLRVHFHDVRYLDDTDVLPGTRSNAAVRLEPPSIDKFQAKYYMKIGEEREYNLRQQFLDSGLQVIVKLATIELTPQKSTYNGGSWHIEGQLNEHICATAIYYYSCENITSSTLMFRQRLGDEDIGNDVRYPQNEHRWTREAYGCDSRGPTVQHLGSVSCHEGRLLTFPNILQHRVAPFQLADPTKPGHRKILALFLVDPGIRIISTAHVPPQRDDWWQEQLDLRSELLARRLPLELQEMVLKELDDFPITMDEAKKLRLELMEERTIVSDSFDHFECGAFSLCEH